MLVAEKMVGKKKGRHLAVHRDMNSTGSSAVGLCGLGLGVKQPPPTPFAGTTARHGAGNLM
jgi:hypothetical protein